MDKSEALEAGTQSTKVVKPCDGALDNPACFAQSAAVRLAASGAVSAWIGSFSRSGPHRLFVATEEERLLGFAGSQQYRSHPAFRKTIETSIYVDPDALGHGVGSALYENLFKEISGEGLHRAVVGIALPNEASVRLHRKVGFTDVGTFAEYAIKNGCYVSSVWMQRELTPI